MGLCLGRFLAQAVELFLQTAFGLGLHPGDFGLHGQRRGILGGLACSACGRLATFFSLPLRLLLREPGLLGFLA